MAEVTTFLTNGGAGSDDDTDDRVDMVDADDDDQEDDSLLSPLIIPITSSTQANDGKELFIEIFPEEIIETPSSTLLQVLREEDAPLSVWADAALLYMQHKQHSRDASVILQAACDQPGGTREETVRILASAGIAHLTQAQLTTNANMTTSGGVKRPGNDPKDELRGMADNKFTNANKVEIAFPMTWVGRGMLNLSIGRLDQAKFFFDTTRKECGDVLPALLGLASVFYGEKNYKGAQDMYAKAIRQYPAKSGAPARVGFALACYRLGQVSGRFNVGVCRGRVHVLLSILTCNVLVHRLIVPKQPLYEPSPLTLRMLMPW
jgi:tetratricopeptide (TPR) repeat protein